MLHLEGGRVRRFRVRLGLLGLLVALEVQLVVLARRNSQTWDEGNHIYAGYRSWKAADFGLNPEHPPLAKLLATAPLLGMPLRVPELQDRFFKREAYLGGRAFVFGNDAEAILLRARLAASLLTLALAAVAFAAAREMFGTGAAFVALTLLAFDPNVLAHGALVTTDVGVSCFLLAAVYAFYRYLKAPSAGRLLLAGLLAGLALATKHTGLLVAPMLALPVLVEWLMSSRAAGEPPTRRGLRLALALLLAGAVAVAVLWSFYGFRYAGRPRGLALNPPLAEWVRQVRPRPARLLAAASRGRLLPESYLYGMADVLLTNDIYTSYLLGKVYPHGVWFYFPIAFAIKSTLAFLVLPLVVLVAIARRLLGRREVLFLALPPSFYLLVAMDSRMNIGLRHLLPVYGFLAVLGGGAAWALARERRGARYLLGGMLLLHVGSSLRAFPAGMAYSNELWGGPAHTYRHLSDSNVDWGQQLKSLRRYLDQRGVHECSFAYFAQGPVEPRDYGIPCRPLPTPASLWFDLGIDAPVEVEGPLVISASLLSGFQFGPGALNPYARFQTLQPTAQIDGGLFVFDGHFELPLAAALSRSQRAQEQLGAGQLDDALVQARQAVALAPDAVRPRIVLGDVLTGMGRNEEARPEYDRALTLARTVEPTFQAYWIPIVEAKLAAASAPH
jgi:tetratricopeptide (TPR) repeat protein